MIIMKKCFLFIGLFVLVIGCKVKSTDQFFDGGGILSLDEIERYVSTFEMDLSTLKETTGLNDDEVIDLGRGLYRTSISRKISEFNFQLQLLTNSAEDPETLWGYQYLLLFDQTGDERIYEVGTAIALDARGLYGEPDTYPGLSGRIFTEDGDLIEGGGHEVWEVLEDIEFQIDLYSNYEQGGSAVRLRYRIQSPRLSRNSDYPKNS